MQAKYFHKNLYFCEDRASYRLQPSVRIGMSPSSELSRFSSSKRNLAFRSTITVAILYFGVKYIGWWREPWIEMNGTSVSNRTRPSPMNISHRSPLTEVQFSDRIRMKNSLFHLHKPYGPTCSFAPLTLVGPDLYSDRVPIEKGLFHLYGPYGSTARETPLTPVRNEVYSKSP